MIAASTDPVCLMSPLQQVRVRASAQGMTSSGSRSQRGQQRTALRTEQNASRVIILAGFAALSAAGFNKGLSVLLWMAMVFCTMGAFIKHEQPFATVLNHWDEMMGYATVLAPARRVRSFASCLIPISLLYDRLRSTLEFISGPIDIGHE
jgi:hypothetical protein